MIARQRNVSFAACVLASLLLLPDLSRGDFVPAPTAEFVSIYNVDTPIMLGSLSGLSYITATTPATVDAANTNFGNAVQVSNQGNSILGVADFSYEYFTSDTSNPNFQTPGNAQIFNFNFYSPGNVLEDTLSITLSGHTVSQAGDANISIDMHFRSFSLDGGIVLPTLPNATSLAATGAYQTVPSLLSDMNIQVGVGGS